MDYLLYLCGIIIKTIYIMGNCKASLGLGMFQVDLKNRDEILGNFYDLLMIDNDLVENEDYFRDDTLKLGYDTEAERIIEERTKGRPITNEQQFRNVMRDVWEAITGQDYFGQCEYEMMELKDGTYIVSWAVGGRDDWD